MAAVLFVCTGNIFRSMIAEYAMKADPGLNPCYRVSSAGIEALPQDMLPYVRERLCRKGADPSGHRQRKLTAEILDSADLVIAMGLDHRDRIREKFGKNAVLFNQVCHGREEPVLDIHEALPDWQTNEDAVHQFAVSVVDRIWSSIPLLIQNVDRFLAQPEP